WNRAHLNGEREEQLSLNERWRVVQPRSLAVTRYLCRRASIWHLSKTRNRVLEVMKRAADIIAVFRQLPIAKVDTITNNRRVMILAPHADDESLGCGGLIAELAATGIPPIVVIVTDGTRSHPLSRS